MVGWSHSLNDLETENRRPFINLHVMKQLPMKRLARSLWPSRDRSILAAITAGLCLFSVVRAQEIDTWIGTGNNSNWTNSGNWTYSTNGTSPQAGDSLVFAGSHTANNNGFPAGTAFYGITFSNGASPFTLSGNSVLLSGQSNNNIIGALNNSAAAQSISLSLSLDWGFHTFDSPAGSLTFGALSLKTGAVAAFDNNVYSSSLTSDASGLISGLGGAGLMYSDSAETNGYAFTGLAGISAGEIATYSGFQNTYSLPPGGGIGSATSLSSGGNIEITDAGADSYTLAGGSVPPTPIRFSSAPPRRIY